MVYKERLFTGYTGRISLALSLGWMATQLGKNLFPPLLPSIIDQLAITPSKAGVALTLLAGVRAVFLYPGGRVSDQLSRKTVLVPGLAVMIVGYLLMTKTSSYAILLGASIIIGVGTGLYSIPTRALISDLYVERRGQALGIFSAAGTVGSALAAGIAIATLTVTAWQYAFIPTIVLLFSVLLLLHYFSAESYTVSNVDLGIRKTLKRVFRTVQLRWLVLTYTLVIFAWTGVLGFLPTFLQVDKNFSSGWASIGFAIPFIVGIVVMPIVGGISDRFSELPVLIGALITSSFGLSVLVIFTSFPILLIGIILFGAGLMAFTPVMQSYLLNIFPSENTGGDFGIFKTVYSGLASFGPVYVGTVAEITSYTLAFTSIIFGLLLSTAITVGVTLRT